MGTNDEIDKLFSSKLENYHLPSSENEWVRLHSDLKWVNFWKFQFYSFNIFYLIGIIGIVVLFSILIINRQSNLPENRIRRDSIQNTMQKQTDSLNRSNNSIFKNNKHYILENKKKNKALQTDVTYELHSDSVTKTTEPQLPQNKISPDSLKKEIAAPQEEVIPQKADTTPMQPRIRKVKRINVVKSDAVIMRDTINITKKQK